MTPYAIAAGYSSYGSYQSWGEWYQRRYRLSETRLQRDLDGEVLYPIAKRAKGDKSGTVLYQKELRPRVSAQVALYGGFVLLDTETEAYAYWQEQHAALSDCSGISPRGGKRRWKPGSLIHVVSGTRPPLHYIDQQDLF